MEFIQECVKRFYSVRSPDSLANSHYYWEAHWWTTRWILSQLAAYEVETENIYDLLASERAERIKLQRIVTVQQRQLEVMAKRLEALEKRECGCVAAAKKKGKK